MNYKGKMLVRFWGVRGSSPTPGSRTARYGGNTACVEVEANGQTIILDAGTGVVPLGRELARRASERGQVAEAVLLFSHLHHDHTQGFPFFSPAFIPGMRLSLFGPDFMGVTPLVTLEQVMQPPYFPVHLRELNASLSFGVVRESDMLLIGDVGEPVQILPAAEAPGDDRFIRVRVMRSYAHPGGVLHYRVEWRGSAVVYATDVEGYVDGDRRLAAFARGADLLIHDAQYTDEHYLGLVAGSRVTQGYGHSTVSMACQAARTAGVKQLALFHHAPEYTDDQLDSMGARARQIFPPTWVSYEGLELRLDEGQAAARPAERLPLLSQAK